MTTLWLRFQAQDTDLLAGLHQRDECVEVSLRMRGLQVRSKDLLHASVVACPRSGATICGSAEPWEVQVLDPGLLQIGGKACLGEAGPPRPSGGANIHEQFDARLAQRVQETAHRRGFIANRGEQFHSLTGLRVGKGSPAGLDVGVDGPTEIANDDAERRGDEIFRMRHGAESAAEPR